MINELNIQRVNAILKNAIEQGRALTPEELITLERLTRDESDPNATHS